MWIGYIRCRMIPALLILGGPGILSAQTAKPSTSGEPLQGFHISLGYTAIKPNLDDTAEALFDAAGRFETGAGMYAELGYEWRRFGMAAGIEIAGHEVGGQSGSSLSFVALFRWRPAVTLAGSLLPAVQLGYLRSGLGSVDLRPSELPPAFRLGGLNGDDSPQSASLIGNGIRTGIELQRKIGKAFAVWIQTSMDATWYTDGTYDEDFVVPESGMSHALRASLGVTWWPF